ncbi:MAG: DNA/RNA non-specific endonuclease [Bacteroidota bacterium]
MRTLLMSLVLLLFGSLGAQSIESQLSNINQELNALSEQEAALQERAENLKLTMIRRDLKAIGLPSDNYVEHSAMILEYAEAYEQASWVAHIIRPEVTTGTAYRSNDFRPDPKITTGTAVEADYFLKALQADSTYVYDGFGYDRGHLAPSADFRWSKKALSESYYYSNMSPQVADFNREGWAELEGLLRGYLYDHPSTQLYVVTGPVLKPGLPTIKRGINGVAIPELYYKVAVDLQNSKAIGFLMPNQELPYPLSSYAVSIDEVESITGLDFFNQLPNQAELESQVDKAYWIPEIANGDVDPLYMPDLPAGHFNTVHAKRHMGSGKTIWVAGTVVSTRYSRSGNLWLNLDKKFPNQVFSVFIRKQDLANFSYDPKAAFEGKVIAVKGKIQDFNGVPTINLSKEEWVNTDLGNSR